MNNFLCPNYYYEFLCTCTILGGYFCFPPFFPPPRSKQTLRSRGLLTLHSGLREVWPSRMDPLMCHHLLELLDNCSSTQSIRSPISLSDAPSIEQTHYVQGFCLSKHRRQLFLSTLSRCCSPGSKKYSAVKISSWLCNRCVDMPFGTTALVMIARMRSWPYHGHDCGGLLHGH